MLRKPMHLLVSGATRTVRTCVGHPHLGVLITPRAKNIRFAVAHELVWGCDNDCYNGLHPRRYKRMVEQVRGLPGLKFVTVPDVVGDHRRTLRRWKQWYPYLKRMGVPCAFVLQDG